MNQAEITEREVIGNEETPTPPKGWKRFTMVGPGLITAATGVGAGDLVAALVAGARYNMTFIWAIVLGALIKFTLNEGVGRWSLATGKTLLQGWRSMGSWTTVYFGIYVVIWGFVYGAAGTSSAALAANAMFPQIPISGWAIIHGLTAFILIWFGRYQSFEKIMTILTGFMFVTVVGSSFFVLPSLLDIFGGLVPKLPDGSLVYALGLIGGVGGSITMASYGYWIKEKKWGGIPWLPMMRMDSAVAYIVTSIFTISLLIMGAGFLFGTAASIEGEKGLITLGEMLGAEFGEWVRWLFLLGFWSASFTSVLGVWNGVPYLFADFVRHIGKPKDYEDPNPIDSKSIPYRSFLAWLTFPPMLLLFLGKPVQLVIIYGVLGAVFMPFLAFTLIWLLNSKRVSTEMRNGWLSNIVLGASILLFLILSYMDFSDIWSDIVLLFH